MITTAQIFTIIGVLCAPMISIAALVLTLAALNLSLGIRRLYVRLLGFIFDYATKIKRDKEISMDSDTSSVNSSIQSPTETNMTLVEKNENDPYETSQSQFQYNHKSESSYETIPITTMTNERQDSKILSPFKLGKMFHFYNTILTSNDKIFVVRLQLNTM